MPFAQRFFGPSEGHDWKLIIGLKEGYTDGVIHQFQEVVEAHKTWVGMQVAGSFVPTGTMTESLLVYAFPQGGYFNGYGTEPVVIFEGRIHPEFYQETPEESVWLQLRSFAEYVGALLNQRRMYIRYAGKELILESDES